MIFVDTGAWYALAVPSDPDHQEAKNALGNCAEPLVTSHYEEFADKDWSFTDCTSYVLMQRLTLKTACSFDHHFRQFGIVNVIP